jgi:hypothetical protein
MNIKLVLASVVAVGSSTAALADAAPANHWVTLSAGDKITADGRATIHLGQTQPLKRIELQATRGRTTVNAVAIRLANGRTEVVKEGVTLERGGKLEIKLEGYRGKDITAVRVMGASSPHGMFELLGETA